jgi:4-amino-4-deoxy-L-arabinose transferase-like glycosyltransferase
MQIEFVPRTMKLVEIENPEDSEPFPGRMILDKAVELIRKRERITIFLCILLAFAVRLFAFSSKYPITGDGVWYATLGKSLAAGNVREGLSTYWPPLYPVLIGVSSLIFGDVELSGRIVSISAGSLLVIPTYLLARTFYGRSVALLTVLILAIHPSIVFYSTAVLTESTYLLFFISGIYAAFVAFSTGRISAFVLTGIAFGACYLLKPEAIGYALLLVLLSGSMKLINRQLTSRKIIINTLALAFTFFLIALPYLIFLQQQTGHWTISDKFVVMSHSFQGWRKLIDSEQLTSADKYWGGWSANTYLASVNNSTDSQDVT